MSGITWRLHLRSPQEIVFEALSSPDGRAKFWAESARETDGVIAFVFPDGSSYGGRVVTSDPPRLFAVEYFGGVATFTLSGAEDGGTDVVLHHEGVAGDELEETRAGWVSVLMQMKAALDFDVDLRNHDPRRRWAAGFVEN